jgi:hypothetical protein
MGKLELKVISTGELITVTDEQWAETITRGASRFYEIVRRIYDEPKAATPVGGVQGAPKNTAA